MVIFRGYEFPHEFAKLNNRSLQQKKRSMHRC